LIRSFLASPQQRPRHHHHAPLPHRLLIGPNATLRALEATLASFLCAATPGRVRGREYEALRWVACGSVAGPDKVQDQGRHREAVRVAVLGGGVRLAPDALHQVEMLPVQWSGPASAAGDGAQEADKVAANVPEACGGPGCSLQGGPLVQMEIDGAVLRQLWALGLRHRDAGIEWDEALVDAAVEEAVAGTTMINSRGTSTMSSLPQPRPPIPAVARPHPVRPRPPTPASANPGQPGPSTQGNVRPDGHIWSDMSLDIMESGEAQAARSDCRPPRRVQVRDARAAWAMAATNASASTATTWRCGVVTCTFMNLPAAAPRQTSVRTCWRP
jgi:hypothetical protein